MTPSFPISASALSAVALSFFPLSQLAQGQTAYNWTITDDAAEWGSGIEDTSGGSYTRAHDLSGQFPQGYSGRYGGDPTFNPINHEGPYDGNSGLIRSFRTIGAYTRTDPNSIFDLSAKDSSVTLNAVYHSIGSQIDSGGSAHLFQFGLSNNASVLGSTGNESLVLAADFNAYTTKDDSINYDLGLYTHAGLDSAPTDGTWNTRSSADLLANGLLDRIYFGAGESLLLNLKYTNLGNGNIRVATSIVELQVSGNEVSDTVTGSSLLLSATNDIANPFTDLSAVRPAFGYSINDSQLPTSGTNFDWEDEYNQHIPVPEPSSTLLALLGSTLLLFRRNR